MAQSIQHDVGIVPLQRVREAQNLDVAVAVSGNTTLLTLRVFGLERIFVQVTPSDNNFDAFSIAARSCPDAGSSTLYSTSGAFTSPAGLIVAASGDLTALAAAATGWFIMDVRGLWEVTIAASATGGVATTDIYLGGY